MCCAFLGDGNSTVAVAAMRLLLAAGAVPDTWAPNGSSALMLAAAANGVAALQVRCMRDATCGGCGGSEVALFRFVWNCQLLAVLQQKAAWAVVNCYPWFSNFK